MRFFRIAICLLVVSCFLSCATNVFSPYKNDAAMWNHITKAEVFFKIPSDVKGVVLPHHLSDEKEINAMWKALSTQKTSTVILLSPDHFLASKSTFTFGQALIFNTSFGKIKSDDDLAKKILANVTKSEINSFAFIQEHGINTHTPFIKKYMPNVKFIPILVSQNATKEALEELIVALKKTLPLDSLVCASVDFSHYNEIAVSLYHDAISYSALLSKNTSRLLTIEADSPGSLYIVKRYAQLQEADLVTQLAHTQLQSYFPFPIADNTSHFHLVFSKKEAALTDEELNATSGILIFPESNREGLPETILNSWLWDFAKPDANTKKWPYLKGLAIDEERFLAGSDMYYFNQKDNSIEYADSPSGKIAFIKLGELSIESLWESKIIEAKANGAVFCFGVSNTLPASIPENMTLWLLKNQKESYFDKNKKILSLKGSWNINETNAEADIGALLFNSDFTKTQVIIFTTITSNGYPELQKSKDLHKSYQQQEITERE